MRAFVVEGEEIAVNVKHANRCVSDDEHAGLACGNVIGLEVGHVWNELYPLLCWKCRVYEAAGRIAR